MMFRVLRNGIPVASRKSKHCLFRTLATEASRREKPEGDISSIFVSLSGGEAPPLPERFSEVKRQLLLGHDEKVKASWNRLLETLQHEIAIVKEKGPGVIPEIDFNDIQAAPEAFRKEHRRRGVAVVRNVVPKEDTLQYKRDIQSYIQANPSTKAFPAKDPQVFELYWSSSQILARSHQNLIATQRFLMQSWHSANPNAPLSTAHPVTYADRLRIRQPGDAGFALGPHVDGGSVERWEYEGYGRGHVYDAIFQGRWEDYDPWESSCRIPIESDLYGGAGACSMFRMFQGWLSMSTTGPGEGTLLVNPLLPLATAYYLLRPFFSPRSGPAGQSTSDSFLRPSNWDFCDPLSTDIQGANPGSCQELNADLHPHLQLADSMVHIPQINPGDFVAWHCDTIHAVDKIHHGSTDSSVLYIPVCPLTLPNVEYLARQRASFLAGTPGPDFPGGIGESLHVGRATEQFARENCDIEGLRAFGLKKWDVDGEPGELSSGQEQVLRTANKVLRL